MNIIILYHEPSQKDEHCSNEIIFRTVGQDNFIVTAYTVLTAVCKGRFVFTLTLQKDKIKFIPSTLLCNVTVHLIWSAVLTVLK